jgi:tripartite ATP-independent transporter DctM subunit
MTLIVLISSFIILLLLGMPVAFVIGISSLAAIVASGEPLVIASHYMFSGVNSFLLVAIPMFILAGDVMLHSGMTRTLTNFADIFVGRLRGGLGHTNIAASVFFSGITGSATADTTAIGSIMIPAMADKGYGRAYATAVTVASSVIGPIIPPSLTFVIYALAVGNVSIGGLFIAGVVPGLLTCIALMIMNHIISKKRNYPKREFSYTNKEIFTITRKSLIVLTLPILIAYGIISGVYTATEAAAIAAGFAILISLITRTIKLKIFSSIFFNAAKTSSIMFLLLATSSLFSYVLATQGVPNKIAETIGYITDNPLVFLLLMNITLLLIGLVLDLFPAILIFGPIFAPIASQYGIDPLQFGIIFCVNLIIGMNTPPVGSGLFIGASIGKVRVEELVKEIFPFIMMQIVVLFLITYVPIFTLGLARMLDY